MNSYTTVWIQIFLYLMFTVVSAPFFFRWNINLIKTHFLCALYKRVHINWGDTWFFSNEIKHTQHKSHFLWRIQRKRTATQERKQIKLRILNTATGSTSIGQRVWAKKWPIQQQIRKKPWCWGGGVLSHYFPHHLKIGVEFLVFKKHQKGSFLSL